MASLGEFGAALNEGDPKREPDTFVFYGQPFTVKERVGAMPLLRFAAVAQSGADADGMEGLAAMYRLITSVLVKDDVALFEQVAEENDADAEELIRVCMALYEAITGRPTVPPSDSADGRSSTTESSKDSSSFVESLPPIQRDERVKALVPVAEASRMTLVG